MNPREGRALPQLRAVRAHGALSAPTLSSSSSSSDAGAANLLIHGDNLAALAALAPVFTGRIRCAYLDPPFNSGRAFAEYNDAWPEGTWTAMMRPRLQAIAPLLADDGAIFVEIDDTELARLTLLMDEVFGEANRISTITVVRSAPTGHKAQNRGPVHTTDFLLAYAKDRRGWKYRPQTHTRATYDEAYRTWLDNPEDAPARWSFRPLRGVVAEDLGLGSSREASKRLGKAAFDRATHAFALSHARHVVRFAQPRYEAIARAAQRAVDRSRAAPNEVVVLERPGRSPFIVRGGNRILFLADKVRIDDGRPVLVEPLTNVWDDVAFQGISREGGVVFSRNKKPERLVARVVAMTTDPGDWVLDPFLGSGTTAAVAHKMGRRWIGIEAGAHATTLCEPRLARVIEGADPTGVSGAYDFRGGGGFRVLEVD